MRGQLVWLWLSVAVMICDQITKHMVSHFLLTLVAYPIFPGFNIVLVHNYGSAFGFLAGASGWQLYFFIAVALLVLIFLVTWLSRMRSNERIKAMAIALILGGALGNMLDRMINGYVIDFIDVYVGSYHWPAFNLADTATCIGTILLIWKMIRG